MSVYAPPRNSPYSGPSAADEADAFITAFEAAIQAFNDKMDASAAQMQQHAATIKKLRMWRVLRRRANTPQS